MVDAVRDCAIGRGCGMRMDNDISAWKRLVRQGTGPTSDQVDNSVTITLISFCVGGLFVLVTVYGLALFCARRRRRERAEVRRMREGAFADALDAPQDVYTAFLQSKGLNRAELDKICPEVVHRRPRSRNGVLMSHSARTSSASLSVLSVTGAASASKSRDVEADLRTRKSPVHSPLRKAGSSGLLELRIASSASLRRAMEKCGRKDCVKPNELPSEIDTEDAASSIGIDGNDNDNDDEYGGVQPSFTSRAGAVADDIETDSICVVCIDEVCEGDLKRILPCPGRHQFHSRCIEVSLHVYGCFFWMFCRLFFILFFLRFSTFNS